MSFTCSDDGTRRLLYVYVSHSRLGTQVDLVLDRKRVYMVMELCQGGELFDRIAECGKLEEDQARQYLVQMALAIEHCHGLNVYHRDLKPENTFLPRRSSDNVFNVTAHALPPPATLASLMLWSSLHTCLCPPAVQFSAWHAALQ